MVELDAETASEVDAIAEQLFPLDVPCIVRLALGERNARQLVLLARNKRNIEASIIGFDNPGDSLRTTLARNRTESARLPILRGAADLLVPSLWNTLLAAASVGERDAPVDDFADLLRISARTLEDRVLHAGLPSPKHLLMWMLVMHASWRIDHLQWSPKRTALEAGLPSGRALSARFHRVLNLSITEARNLSFGDVLERFRITLRHS